MSATSLRRRGLLAAALSLLLLPLLPAFPAHGQTNTGTLRAVTGFHPGTIRVLAALPGFLGPEIRLDVVSVGPGGKAIDGAAEPGRIAGLPPVSFTGTDGLVLHRLADRRVEEGYSRYLSEDLAVVGDLRAARTYRKTTEEERSCARCAPPEPKVREVLSGERIAVRFPEALRAQLAGIYSPEKLDRAELSIPSVRWDATPALHQEPAQNPSHGTGDVFPGTLLHSGELTLTATDLMVKSRGLDFVFTRTYRSQTLGAGPLGPGWDFNYHLRLRELPSKDVELYDGRGRRELFSRTQEGYRAPPGRFWTLTARQEGWVALDPAHDILTFDRWGRLTSIADPSKHSAETGNEMTFHYDLSSRLVRVTDTLGRDYDLTYDQRGRLVQLEDFTGRKVRYAYDAEGRLESVTSPAVTVGEQTYPEGLTTRYAYADVSAETDLATYLNRRDDLVSVTDPKGQTWLAVTYDDADGDGRAEEVVGERWGEGELSIAYDFAMHRATVTDRRGHTHGYLHNANGQATRIEDAGGFVTLRTFDAEGLLTSRKTPLGRVTRWSYDEPCEAVSPPPLPHRRSRGTVTRIEVEADSRGPNGSAATLRTCIDYHKAWGNRPVKIVSPRGEVTEIHRDRVGLPVERVEATGSPAERHWRYEHNRFGQMTRLVNPNGHATTYTYFGAGAPTGYLHEEVVDPGGLGLQTRFAVDPRGNVTAVTDPRGVRFEQVWNELDQRVALTRGASPSADGAPALGYTTRFLFDPNGNLAERRRPFGETGTKATAEHFTYGVLDELREVRREITPGGEEAVTKWSYDPNLNPVQRTDPEGEVTAWTYDDRDLVESLTHGSGQPEASTETFAYDGDGEVVVWTNGRGAGWPRFYDGYGRLRQLQDPIGHRRTFEYDDDGNVTSTEVIEAGSERVVSRSGAEYDLFDRPTATLQSLWTYEPGVTDVPGTARELRTERTFDPVGNVLAVKDPAGRTARFTYDAAERRTSMTDPVGNVTRWTLDPTGNVTRQVVEELAPDGSVTEVFENRTWDTLGRLSTVTDALGNRTSFDYDGRDHVVRQTDPRGFLTTFRWDGLDRLTERVRPEGIAERLTWDRSSRRVAYADAQGHTTRWAYDALDRPTSVTYPDTTTWSYRWDAASNLVGWTDPNGTAVTQEFDDRNLLLLRQVTPGPGVLGPKLEAFHWDGLGRLLRGESEEGGTDFTYDSLSRLLSEKTDGREVTYRHDDIGNPTRISYPSGLEVETTWDGLDRPTAIGERAAPGAPLEPLASYAYRGPFRVAREELGKGVGQGLDLTRSYDPVRRLLQQKATGPSGKALLDERVSWSPRSLKASSLRRDENDRISTFAHDQAGRLATSVSSLLSGAAGAPDNNQPFDASQLAGLPELFGFFHDSADNLVEKLSADRQIKDQVPLPPDPSGRNRPESVGDVPLSYDANGNLIQKGDLRFAYDFHNRLTRVTDPQGEVARYRYDVFNRRVARTVRGDSLETAWSGWRELEDYRDGALAARRVYGRKLDEQVRLERDTDGDGTPDAGLLPLYDSSSNLVALLTPEGQAVERSSYTPFGKTTFRVGAGAPKPEQIRIQDDEIWMGFAPEIDRGLFEKKLESGEVGLRNHDTGEPYPGVGRLPQVASLPPLPEKAPHQAGQSTAGGLSTTTAPALTSDALGAPPQVATRWFIVHLTSPPPAGTVVDLVLPAGSTEDLFGHATTEPYTLTFPWPDADQVLDDTTPPRIEAVRLRQGHLEVDLSEKVNLASAQAAISVGQPVTWELAGDGFTLRTQETLTPGTHNVEVGTGLADLGGNALPKPLQLAAKVPEVDPNLGYFKKPDPQGVERSSVGNRFGFQGRPRDPETGFIYFRNRYYDPELGRFLTPDPMGYGDGPNLYQFAGSNPVDQSDPLGLYCRECAIELERRANRIRRRREQKEDAETLRSGMALVNQLAGQPGVTEEILRTALLHHLLSRPRVDRYEAAQLTAFLTARLTGAGPSNQLNLVAGELKGMRRSARFAELYPGIFLGMADAGDLAFGVGELATLARQVGVRGALHETFPGLADAARMAGDRAVPGGVTVEGGLERTRAIRSALDVGKDRTVAFARVEIGSTSQEVIGVSGKAFRGATLGDARIAANTSRVGPGRLDAEVKILDELTARLAPDATGSVTLFVDRAACFNCGTAILEFRRAFPNIELNVVAP